MKPESVASKNTETAKSNYLNSKKMKVELGLEKELFFIFTWSIKYKKRLKKYLYKSRVHLFILFCLLLWWIYMSVLVSQSTCQSHILMSVFTTILKWFSPIISTSLSFFRLVILSSLWLLLLTDDENNVDGVIVNNGFSCF